MIHTVEILKAARTRIAEREHWVVGMRACSPRGVLVRPRSPRAVAWCAGGALAASSSPDDELVFGRAYDILRAAAIEFGYESIEELNDRGSHVMVMRMFDRAIAMATADEAAAT